MAGYTTPPRIPLPHGWSRRVRSGVIHAISLAHFSMTSTRSWAANSWNARIRLKTENDRLRDEIALIKEEMRIKDSRMLQIPAQRRPHYPPIERLAILELRAARAWSLSQTAQNLLITTATVASWMHRLDEDGPRILVQTREPVNRFPDFVAYIVQRLKVLCPSLGRVKIAQMLCRAGLHLGPATVGRWLQSPPRRRPRRATEKSNVMVRSKRPCHIWHCDLTTVPTSLGFWVSALPFALPQRWPFCWWVAVTADHYSRRIMGTAVFQQQPTSEAVRTFIGRAMKMAQSKPKHLITDQGVQFTAAGFRKWCQRKGIRQRFGAIGKYGSIAVIERLMRTIKSECTRKLIVSYRREDIRRELSLFTRWYNQHRPHAGLIGCTPDEIYFGKDPAVSTPRFEPRKYWPRGSPCAAPRTSVKGRCGIRLELKVRRMAGRRHLPIVELKKAA